MKSASECADSGGCRKQQAVAERTGTKLIPHRSTTAAVGLVGSRLGETSYVQRLSESFALRLPAAPNAKSESGVNFGTIARPAFGLNAIVPCARRGALGREWGWS